MNPKTKLHLKAYFFLVVSALYVFLTSLGQPLTYMILNYGLIACIWLFEYNKQYEKLEKKEKNEN